MITSIVSVYLMGSICNYIIVDGIYGIRQGDLFRSCGRLIVLLPKCQEQSLDALTLLDVKDLILGEERIERDGTLVRVCIVYAVLTTCLSVNHLAESLVGVSRIDQDHMRALLVILSDEVVHEERLSASRGSEHELVAVGCHAFPHRQVRDVYVQRLATDAVCHLDTER